MFTTKIVLSSYGKDDGTRSVLLQAIMDRKRVVIPLGFCLHPEDFDKRRQSVKESNPNHGNFIKEFQSAVAKAHGLASKMRNAGITITPPSFRKEFTTPSETMDVIKFIEHEIELKQPVIAPNTYKQYKTLVNKLKEHKKVIPFSSVSVELLQEFRNKLVRDGNGPATIEKMMKIFKQHLAEARKKGIIFKDIVIKIRHFKSNRQSLTEEELLRLHNYFISDACPPNHKKLLRYFLFSCYSGLRISDIGKITWKNISGDILNFIPVKTKKDLRTVSVPLGPERKYLPDFKEGNEPIFETFADAVSNRYLKDIIKVKEVAIHKNITYHTARHTAATLMVEGGHLTETQQMLGHGDIKTTMGYVHTSTKNLVDAKKQRFG